MIKYLLYPGLVLCLLLGCKSKSRREIINPPIPLIQDLSSKINTPEKTHFFLKLDSSQFLFSSFSAKGSVNFNHNGETHSAEINIRIKKDEIIWFYINLSIIPVAQGYITPTEIKFKNLLSGEYTHKSFEYLQEIAGMPIRFQDLQGILLGNKLDSFLGDSTRFRSSDSGESFLEGIHNGIKNQFSFNSQYRPLLINLQDSLHNRKVILKYGNFLPQNGTFIPQSILINAQAPDNNLEIQMDYRKILINPDQEYPFHSPDGSN